MEWRSYVTTLPSPPPALILAPRIGYLPLLVPQVKPFFSSALPPGVDTVWFDYKGLPLKWYSILITLAEIYLHRPQGCPFMVFHHGLSLYVGYDTYLLVGYIIKSNLVIV
ncbi:hypothetical protein POM88_040742 [Heracleum sosnowskyi]|uniref:Autophagy protein ATG5 UblA domain-containing protein n=1 Tax=Heracleum sosnowskyi TaxID=360622 RepID=A0AAD8HDQ3_9APIA|nr:hypothetical protein POM88_040742 [Heracleum sosnowskyi]